VVAAGLWGISARLEAQGQGKAALTRGFQRGATGHQSIGALAFAPEGVLFFADPQGSAVYAVDLGETKVGKAAPIPKIEDLGATLAARMGTTAEGIAVQDMAVSPISGMVYVSVAKRDGGNRAPADASNYALFAIDRKGDVTPVDLGNALHGKATLGTAADARITRITDLAYGGHRLFVAALSTEQFASKLYSVPVPMVGSQAVQPYSTNIYHTSHKRWETRSPIQTLTPYRKDGQEYVIGAYVCTPIVRFSLDNLQPGGVAKGVTVAELGAGNQPVEMVAYGKGSDEKLLVSNSRHGTLRVESRLLNESAAVDEKAAAREGREVAGIERMPTLDNVTEMGLLSDSQLVVLRKGATAGVSLETVALP
jgi:hypothetical protein